ncbi:hypothetical protein Emed_003973 [Eimeria media]
MDSRDRQGQPEHCDIYDYIDVVGSLALNARQPQPQAAATSTTAGKSTTTETGGEPSAPPAAPASEAPPTATEAEEPVKASAEESSAGEQKEDSDAADKTTRSAEGGHTEPQAEGRGSQTPGASPAAAAAPTTATCEVATLQQLLQNKMNSLALVSDVDEQLLLNISFKQPVRLTAFSMLASTPPAGFSVSADAEDSVSGPMLVKVFCNKSSLNFCGVADEACAFSVMLSAEDILQERRIALPGSKFQMCSSVQLFVQENQEGSSYTFINRLALFGVAHKRYS